MPNAGLWRVHCAVEETPFQQAILRDMCFYVVNKHALRLSRARTVKSAGFPRLCIPCNEGQHDTEFVHDAEACKPCEVW